MKTMYDLSDYPANSSETIDTLLQLADNSIRIASHPGEWSLMEQFAFMQARAQIAQAAALTAQALIMREEMQNIRASNERAEIQALWRQ